MSNMSEFEQQAAAFLQSYQLAEQGDAEAQFQTGLCYAQGTGVQQSYQHAGLYWLNAAKQSHLAAQTHLGVLFEKGLGFSQDYDKARHCYASAAALGDNEAKVRLAMLYLKGLGTPQDIKKAIMLFIEAAEQGEATAQYNLAAAYEKGLGGLTQNDDLAQFWYQQAADQNHQQAQAHLQDAKFSSSSQSGYFSTSSANKSKSNASDSLSISQTAKADWWKTEDLQLPTAQNNGYSDDDLPVHPDSEAIFAKGVTAIQTDIKKAFNFFEQAALLGHAKAQYNMGLAFLYGIGGNHVCSDTAVEWLEKSANQSFRPAYLVLGWLYQGGNPYIDGISDDIGEAIIIDYSNAISQYEMASELDHAQAQYFLAQIYATGNGTVVDRQKSTAWLKQSAKHGYQAAAYQLLTCNDQ